MLAPEDGRHPDAPLRLRLLAHSDVSEARLLLEQDGEPVAGTWTHAGGTAWLFEPSAALAPSTTYAWTLETELGCEAGEFTTAAAAVPVEDPALLVGRTYEAVFDPGLGTGFVSNTLALSRPFETVVARSPEAPFVLRIDELDGVQAAATLAMTDREGHGWPQLLCEPTVALAGSWDGATLRFQGEGLQLPIYPGGTELGPPEWAGRGAVELVEWSLAFVIHPDGQAATLGHFSFTADTRTAGLLLDEDLADVEGRDLCEMFESMGVDVCFLCADGFDACLHGHLAGAPGQQAPAIVDVAEGQQENHLCPDACTDGVDDDADGDADSDPECDPSLWP